MIWLGFKLGLGYSLTDKVKQNKKHITPLVTPLELMDDLVFVQLTLTLLLLIKLYAKPRYGNIISHLNCQRSNLPGWENQTEIISKNKNNNIF